MEVKENPSEENMVVEILPPKLKEWIESIAKSEGFITYEILSKTLTPSGSGFMGILYEIDVKGKTTDGAKELNIFVKNIPENEQMKIYSVSGVFEREAFIYTDVFKIYAELQDEANIPYNERFKIAKTYEECNPRSIILEHLGKRGFKVYNRMETVTLGYAKLCVQQLGKFHALSMILQEKRPEYFKENIASMKQPFVFEEDWYGFVKNMYDYSINCLEDDVKEKVGQIILEKIDDYPKYMSDISGLSTLCHGDYKLNNVMAKEVNGVIKEVITIDFQISHYGCPVLDFLYFIFNGTDQEFRKNHLSNLKDVYYEAMNTFLVYFGLDIGKIFPRNEFERVYKEKLDFGLMINVFYVPFLFAAEDDAPDVANATLSTLSFQVDSRFTDRFRGIVDDFIQWGYFDITRKSFESL